MPGTRGRESAQMTDKRRLVVAIALLSVLSPLLRAAGPHEFHDRATIEAFTRKFLHAFHDLDMKQFTACFADDATVFFPVPEPPERVQGKQAIQRRFEQVFDSIRRAA